MTEKIKTLKIIHLAICAGTIMGYLFVGNISIETINAQSINSSDYIYFTIPIIAFFLSNFLFKSQLKQVDTKLKPEDNLPIYQTASIVRWAVLEAAAFFILFMKENLLLLGIIIIAYLVFLRPTEDRINRDLSNLKID